jgi:UPF0716 protein FxsA
MIVAMLFFLLLFIVLPVAEIYVIVKVGEAIGILPTLALLIVDGFVGAALARSQGAAAWRRFNEALSAGRVPAKEVVDGAMVIIGGAFLLAPGFITDAIGLLLLLPPTRALLRTSLTRVATRRMSVRVGTFGPGAPPGRYDYEGSAHEVTDPDPELPPGDPDD